jgi:hypothetical protein
LTLRNEKDCPNFLNGLCKYSVQFGIKIGIREVIIPKFIDNLSDWFKKILNEKLLPLLLNAFDQYFENLGTHLIILQKKYNIKKYTNCILNNIKKFFHIICDIQKIISPYLKESMQKAKSGRVNTLQIINEFIDKLFSKMENIMKPIKEFVDKVFDGNEKLEAYKLYENVIAEGTAEKVAEVEGAIMDGSLHVFDTSTFTVGGKTMEEIIAEDETYAPYVYDGYFHESELQSAPSFALIIDGITEI